MKTLLNIALVFSLLAVLAVNIRLAAMDDTLLKQLGELQREQIEKLLPPFAVDQGPSVGYIVYYVGVPPPDKVTAVFSFKVLK